MCCCFHPTFRFFDATIGGLVGPLHNGPIFGTIFPKYFVNLDDPQIYNIQKYYIFPQGFKMDEGSKIIQIKSMVYLRFGNDTLHDLQDHVHQSLRLLSAVEHQKSKNATPISFDWTSIKYRSS
jgi:hypothetical protein